MAHQRRSSLVKEDKTIYLFNVFVSVSRCSLSSFLENGAAAPACFQMRDSSCCWNRGEEKKERESRVGDDINDECTWRETEQSKHPSNRLWSSLITVKTNILHWTVCVSMHTHTYKIHCMYICIVDAPQHYFKYDRDFT